ncbi:MAG: dihydropteroate synthase [Armatimonadota bacterium]|nr:MAG: dihydropteroate synthase [Armatimonadota bacterium]
MYVIGERINGMFKDVRQAIQAQDKGIIQDLAKKQLAGGAHCLDVNVGPASDDPVSTVQWLVETIREVTDAPLAIDTTKHDVMATGIKAAGKGSVINSTTGQQEKLDVLLPLAAENDASLIALTIDEKGIPRDANGRVEIALRVVAGAMEHGISPDRIYVDGVIIPVSADQMTPTHVLNTISQCKMLADPPPKTILGLSNVSQGAVYRELINRTYMVMALAHGLDAAILDPMDTELMDALITAELLLNRNVYCADFLKAYRASAA